MKNYILLPLFYYIKEKNRNRNNFFKNNNIENIYRKKSKLKTFITEVTNHG